MTSAEKTKVVFENLQHDFPQRIQYERQEDALLAQIDGTIKGTVKKIAYPMKRAACR